MSNDEKPKVDFADVECALKTVKADQTATAAKRQLGKTLAEFYETGAERFHSAKTELGRRVSDALQPFTRDEAFVKSVCLQIELRHAGIKAIENALAQLRQANPDWSAAALIRVAEQALSIREIEFIK